MTGRSTVDQGKYGSTHSGEDLSKASSAKKKASEETPVTVFQQIRDICESLVIALFLAFLFKTFEAEAFVIPTGSMAPTLKGRHKDVECHECYFQFQTSASEEVDPATNRRNGRHVVAGTCPQCGYTQYFGDDVPNPGVDGNAPSFTGDRILVSKLAFDQREVRRFDVSVFRSPADPKTNFIKRIVGFPNERLRVQYGDLFAQKVEPSTETDEGEASPTVYDNSPSWSPDVNLDQTDGGSPQFASDSDEYDGLNPFVIQRKEYRHLRQVMQLVYDADYSSETLDALGWPQRWSDDWERLQTGVRGWTVNATKKKKSFSFAGHEVPTENSSSAPAIEPGTEADVSPLTEDDATIAWLRYRHIIPSSSDWFYLSDGKLPPAVEATGRVSNNPRLIDDFSGYNAGISRFAQPSLSGEGYRWSDAPEDEFTQLSNRTADKRESGRFVLRKNPDGFGCNWVGDLGVSCELTIQKATTETDKVVFDLVKGGVVFRCEILPAQDLITLKIPTVPAYSPVQTSYKFQPGKKYNFAFYNVDEEMRVAVNDKELAFPEHGGRYDFLTASANGVVELLPRNRDPNARDLAPVAIGARGVPVDVKRLRVLRDVYYIAAGYGMETWDSARFTDFGTPRCDRLTKERVYLGNEDDAARFMSSPEMWLGYGNTKSTLLRQRADQYVALGDNSGFSLDSRLWATNTVPHYVDRKYLIGKAFYVYWPHGKPLPIIGSPFWPNFKDMRHVD